jgi:hypothetical protein
MPLQKNEKKEQKNLEVSERKKLRVRKPKMLNLNQEAQQVLDMLEANLVSVGLRRLEVRRYENQDSVTYLIWLYHTPGEVAFEGSGPTISHAIASLLNAANRHR